MTRATATLFATLLGLPGGALVYWGGFVWWAESDSPWYRAARDYHFRQMLDAGLFIAPGALLIVAAVALGVVAIRARRRNSN